MSSRQVQVSHVLARLGVVTARSEADSPSKRHPGRPGVRPSGIAGRKGRPGARSNRANYRFRSVGSLRPRYGVAQDASPGSLYAAGLPVGKDTGSGRHPPVWASTFSRSISMTNRRSERRVSVSSNLGHLLLEQSAHRALVRFESGRWSASRGAGVSSRTKSPRRGLPLRQRRRRRGRRGRRFGLSPAPGDPCDSKGALSAHPTSTARPPRPSGLSLRTKHSAGPTTP